MIVEPGAQHAAIMKGSPSNAGTAGNLVNDAHLAALAIGQRGAVISFDSDFERFFGVRWERPT